MSMRRVLVTGASGFVGRQTIAPLLDLSFEVHAVGSRIIDPRARWHRADLLDRQARRQLVAAVKPDAVLHCAWVGRPAAYWTAPENLDWVAASLDLVRLAVTAGARHVVVTGSCAEYDWRAPPPRPWREDDPCHPASLYGTAKNGLHQMLAAFAAQADIGLTWVRLFHLYGPEEAAGRLVPSLLAALRNGRQPATGPTDAVRDLLHVGDAGRALVRLLAARVNGPVNVASGVPVSVGALAGMLARLAGRPDLTPVATRRSGEPPILLADIGRLAATGFTPHMGLEDGLAALWAGSTAGAPVPAAVQDKLPLIGPSDPVAAAASAARLTPADQPATTARPPEPPSYAAAARLFRLNRWAEARSAAKAVLVAQPDHPAALNLLGVLHRQQGEFAAARACLERAAGLDPENETAWVNLGNVHLDVEDADQAVEAYRRALVAAPARIDTLRLLGNALARAGRDAEAIARFDQGVAAAPQSIDMLRDRGRAHFAAGRVAEALADIDAALANKPDDIDLALVRARMLRLDGRREAAAELLKHLLDQAPEHADVHLALADMLLAEEQREQANLHYQKAVELRPDDDNALGRLCWSLLNSRYGDEATHIAAAAAIARRIVATGRAQPGSAHAVQSALLRVADLDTLAAFDALFPDRRALLDYWVRRNVVGALHAQLGRVVTLQDRLTLVDCHRNWGDRYESRLMPLRPNRSPPGPRIRVGFVSSDLRHHPVSYFALPMFEHYDRDRFDFLAYSFHPAEPDAVQRHIAGRIAAFRRMPNMPEQQIAQRIADDRLDILFELGGSTHLNRLEVMAHQPAPVQVSWLGYPHSSGLSRIGHILVDPYLKPPDPALLLERPFEMPSSWVSLGRLGFAEHEILPTLPQQRHGRLTFGTMNNPYKYAPQAIALWAEVLRAVPDSRFLVVRPEAGVALFRDNMARAFGRHGVDAARLDYAAVRGRHMPYYNDIDIALDTLPQTGGTTTCEALWMGVPTISLVGQAFFERLSYSNLVNAGLSDLAVQTPPAYVAAAVALAGDPERRRALRLGLRTTIRRSALGDSRRWVEDFQALIVRTLDAG